MEVKMSTIDNNFNFPWHPQNVNEPFDVDFNRPSGNIYQ